MKRSSRENKTTVIIHNDICYDFIVWTAVYTHPHVEREPYCVFRWDHVKRVNAKERKWYERKYINWIQCFLYYNSIWFDFCCFKFIIYSTRRLHSTAPCMYPHVERGPYCVLKYPSTGRTTQTSRPYAVTAHHLNKYFNYRIRLK